MAGQGMRDLCAARVYAIMGTSFFDENVWKVRNWHD